MFEIFLIIHVSSQVCGNPKIFELSGPQQFVLDPGPEVTNQKSDVSTCFYNIPRKEHTSNPQPTVTVYESGVNGDAWHMLQGYVGVLLQCSVCIWQKCSLTESCTIYMQESFIIPAQTLQLLQGTSLTMTTPLHCLIP